MGIGTKMCKFKTLEYTSLIGRLTGQPTIVCSNPDLSTDEIERVRQDLKYCTRRFCKHYESRRYRCQIKECSIKSCPLWRYRMGTEEHDELYYSSKKDAENVGSEGLPAEN